MSLIDTHAHLYLPDFNADIAEVVKRAKQEGVEKIYLPAIDQEVIDPMLNLENQFPGFFYPMMGVHPCSIKAGFQRELSVAEEWLNKRAFSAIGEIGLDFYWDKTFVREQYEAFELQITWARDRQLPIVIHSREAGEECFEVVKKLQDGRLRGVFHCFSGSLDLANRITALG